MEKADQDSTDKFWIERGAEIRHQSLGHKTTGPDFYQNLVQVSSIKKYLRKTDHILDVGSGIGDNTIEFSKIVTRVDGLEFSNTLLNIAIKKRNELKIKNLDFMHEDIRHFKSTNKYDKVISIQCLINLMTFEDQKSAIDSITSVLKAGGLYLMLEPSKEALESVNKFRTRFGLQRIEESFHNNNFNEKELLEYMDDKYTLVERVRTLSTYYFLSRIFHPLLVSPEEPKYDSKINEIAAKIAIEFPTVVSGLDCSPLYVFQKL